MALALAEDLGVPVEQLAPTAGASVLGRDVTSEASLPPDVSFEGAIVAREPLVVAGLPVAERVWTTLASSARSATPSRFVGDVEVFPLVAEGAHVRAGTRLAEVRGPVRMVLAGERTALNFLMVLSGIASQTARWVAEAGPTLAVCDTRKTYPGLRALSKYAVRVGGGTNHRDGLWDMALVKDNHIAAAGGIEAAVRSLRAARPDVRVEVEADSIGAARDAAHAGADMVLFDNMSEHDLAEAVRTVRAIASAAGRRILTEASGGIRLDWLAGIKATGVDRVSTSALTLAPPADIALDEDVTRGP